MHIKFVIWGAGFRGKKMLLYMPHDRIDAIIDSDEELCGQSIDDIPIISFEEYKNKYIESPIIITPALHQKDIKNILETNGIYNGLPFSFDIEAWFMQLDQDELLEKFDMSYTLGICGYTVIGLLLCEYFINKGIEDCRLFVDDKKIQKFLESTYHIETRNNFNCDFIFKTQKDLILDSHVGENCLDLYDISIRKDLFVKEYLSKFKNINDGSRIFLVATGPSLQVADLDKLYQNKEICMSFNGIFHAFEKTNWRPNYYNVNDSETAQRWKTDIMDLKCDAKFVADVAWYYEDNEIKDNIYQYHLFREDLRSKNGESDFSFDFVQGTYGGSTVVYSGIQIAIYMGFKEIYLLGADCNYSFSEKSTHFYSDSKEERSNKAQENEGIKMIRDYEVAKRYADSCGVKIYNATRGGKLEVFERINFDTLFKK